MPLAPARPAARGAHSYPSAVGAAFDAREAQFFGSQDHSVDPDITIESPFGHFKVFTYPNLGPSDIHFAVFFCNAATAEVTVVHGTIAAAYLVLVRNRSGVIDIPIADHTTPQDSHEDRIAHFSRYALRWDHRTNAVSKRWYTPWVPGSAARVDQVESFRNDVLVIGSEGYAMDPRLGVAVANWRDEPGLAKYDSSVSVRSPGWPTQILLHETAVWNDMAISNVHKEPDQTYYPIPHLCVNMPGPDGGGRVIQFVDLALNTPHGEATNGRSVGIEFANPPIESYPVNPKTGRRGPAFKLETSFEGVYLLTKLRGLSKLFLRLHLSAKASPASVELRMPAAAVANLTTLRLGVGPTKEQVVTDEGSVAVVRFAAAPMYEHLVALVTTLVGRGLVRGIGSLADESMWRSVVRRDGKALAILQHAWTGTPKVDAHHAIDLRLPGILTHLLIGGHFDGATQGLYLYLRLVRGLTPGAALQAMVDLLTSPRTEAEKAGFTMPSILYAAKGRPTVVDQHPVDVRITDVVELDDAIISAAARRYPP